MLLLVISKWYVFSIVGFMLFLWMCNFWYFLLCVSDLDLLKNVVLFKYGVYSVKKLFFLWWNKFMICIWCLFSLCLDFLERDDIGFERVMEIGFRNKCNFKNVCRVVVYFGRSYVYYIGIEIGELLYFYSYLFFVGYG